MSEIDSKKILNQYINNLYTEDEAVEFFRLLKSDLADDGCLIDQCMQSVWDDAEATYGQDSDRLKRHAFIYESEARLLLDQHRKKTRFFLLSKNTKRWLAVACSVLLVCLCGGLGYHYSDFLFSGECVETSVSTTYGELRTVELPDGTKVELNSKSKITYPTHFRGDFRKVILCGEAYFMVTKNKKMPFVISAGQFKVKVLGTRFNVKAYPKDIVNSVAVEQGKVQVDMPESMTRLIANERMAVNKETRNYIKFTKKESVAVWRSGTLRFLKTPIRDVFNELERKYHCRVILEGSQFNNYITGELPGGDIESVLKSIGLTTGIRYRYDAQKRNIYMFK